MPPFAQVFHEIAALLSVAALLGALGLWLRQPLIVAFLGVGVLVGPAALGWVQSADQIDLLAKLGIALLLFVVGLRLDLHLIRTLGWVALATGLGQVLFTSLFGYLIALGLGFEPVTALYVAVALTFSSTIIIVKLLSDKREIDSLHGRISVGFLIVQDVVVVLAMIGLNALGMADRAGPATADLLRLLLQGGAFLAAILLLMRWGLPQLVRRIARSQELLLLFAITWALALAALGDLLGFSKELGAFLAGISLASTPFRESLGARLSPLRDFLLIFFFIDLGAQLDLSQLGAQIGPALIFSAFVLLGNPLIVMVIMGAMGYRRRTGFLAGLTVAQISEFSLILTALGVGLGHVGKETLGLVTLVGLITIGLSTYMILYSHDLYRWMEPVLVFFERRRPTREQEQAGSDGPPAAAEILLFGLGRFGGHLFEELSAKGVKVLGIDFDPQIVERWNAMGLPACYGDATDPDLPATLPMDRARWAVSCLPDRASNLVLLQELRQQGFRGSIALTSHTPAEAETFLAAGAERVLLPFRDGARGAAEQLIRTF